MPTNVNDKIRNLSPAQRKKVEARAAELIADLQQVARNAQHIAAKLPR